MSKVDPEDHLGLVYDIVGEMVRPGGSHLHEDLMQEGMLGMVEAARRFDPTRGTTFATFASRYIRGRVLSAVRDWLGAVRLPRYRWAMGERPALSCSLDQPALEGGDETTIPANRIADDAARPEEEAAVVECRAVMTAGIDALPPCLRDVLRARFVEELTLDEIGERCGISRQAVQQREARAIALLRIRLARKTK